MLPLCRTVFILLFFYYTTSVQTVPVFGGRETRCETSRFGNKLLEFILMFSFVYIYSSGYRVSSAPLGGEVMRRPGGGCSEARGGRRPWKERYLLLRLAGLDAFFLLLLIFFFISVRVFSAVN